MTLIRIFFPRVGGGEASILHSNLAEERLLPAFPPFYREAVIGEEV